MSLQTKPPCDHADSCRTHLRAHFLSPPMSQSQKQLKAGSHLALSDQAGKRHREAKAGVPRSICLREAHNKGETGAEASGPGLSCRLAA